MRPRPHTSPQRLVAAAGSPARKPVRQQPRAAPTGTPRPNPQSQSFSRGYGSVLPTSLIYIVLSTRGCAPWRPDAVMSTTRGENKSRHRVFKGRRERTGRNRGRSAFPRAEPYRRIIRFQGPPGALTRKDNSCRDSRRRPRFRLCCHSVSTSWLRNVNLIPFR